MCVCLTPPACLFKANSPTEVNIPGTAFTLCLVNPLLIIYFDAVAEETPSVFKYVHNMYMCACAKEFFIQKEQIGQYFIC